MPRRIEVELTSSRDDGTWTWRAAGARQPKGELDGRLLPSGAKVGDVVRADADFDIDGITVTAVLPPKGARREPERIELIGPPRDEQLVTTVLAPGSRSNRRGDGDRRRPPRDRGDRGDRGDRPPRRERSDRPPTGDGSSRPRRSGSRDGERSSTRPSSDRAARVPRRERPSRPAPEPRPKAKRLRAGRVHRAEVLASLPEEQKPIAEQVLRGGIPAVRQAVDKQNEQARAAGSPEIKADGIVSIAEQLLPRLRAAEWHDKADAALADVDEVALTDLRAVVVAADRDARDEVTRPLADQLREALSRRVDQEHRAWLSELAENLAGGRTVRALRLSSRPPKAGSPLPAELSTRLADAASAGLTADTAPDRYATVLDALAYSPVRTVVVPQGVPAEPEEALLTAVRKLASRLPQIATAFGVESTASKPRPAKSAARPIPAPPPLADTPPAPEVPPVVDDAVVEPEEEDVVVVEEVVVEPVVDDVVVVEEVVVEETAPVVVADAVVEEVVVIEEPVPAPEATAPVADVPEDQTVNAD
jgi:hypothetical protein